MSKEKLLKIRKEKRSSNPKFIRQDIHKKKKLDKIWRKPRGMDSKKRLMKNNRSLVKPGYGSPSEIRGMSRSGKIIVKVETVSEIVELKPTEHEVIVSRKVGFRQKKKILKELKKKGFAILNIKDVDKYIKAKEDAQQERRKLKLEKSKKEEKKKEKKKEKESIEDKLSEDDKKKLEKKEIDRLLTKKF